MTTTPATLPSEPKRHQIMAWSADDIGFQKVALSPGKVMEFNRIFHDEIVMLAFTHSTWRSEQNGRDYLETPQHVIVRDAGQIYSARLEQSSKEAPPECREIYLSRDRFTRLMAQSEDALPPIDFSNPCIDDPQVRALFVKTHQAFERGDCLLDASTQLSWLMARMALASSGCAVQISAARCQKRSRLVIDYLRENFYRKVTLEDLSRVCEVNPYVLLRQFKAEQGVTPHEYLMAYRLYKARHYLRAGLSSAEVALMCGFSDQSHLIRRFKQRLGVSPGSIVHQGLHR